MPYQVTTALQKLRKLNKRIKGITGGTSASKTVSILQILIDSSQNDKPGEITSITSESMPHLKRGAMRDFLNVMQEQEYFDANAWNKTDFIYTHPGGGSLEFFSLDMPHKVRGPRRKRLFINEANNIPLETFDQLEVRTTDDIWLDWNPVSEFWWYTDVLPKRDVDFVTLTYKDNEALSPSIVEAIESRKWNKNWWQVYGLGQLGEAEGKIYTGWNLELDEVPFEARLERYGLDFGYTNDPTAIVAIYYYNGGYILDEIAYQRKLDNKMIADILNTRPKALVMADGAEPKSIDEISSFGVSISAAEKGQGSVYQGIQYVQQQKISVTKRSINIIKAYRNYLFRVDKDGRITNDPDDTIHEWSNSMDAIRYGFAGLRPLKYQDPRPAKNWSLA